MPSDRVPLQAASLDLPVRVLWRTLDGEDTASTRPVDLKQRKRGVAVWFITAKEGRECLEINASAT